MQQQAGAYRTTEVNTADSIKVVSLLYDGAINFIQAAKLKIGERDIAGKGLYIGKATSIVAELSAALNMEAGEIAGNLRKLYDFVLDRLFQANLKDDPDACDDAERVLQELRGAWKEIEKRPMQNQKTPESGIEVRI
jgi:flagellar secretion chaperone FliS